MIELRGIMVDRPDTVQRIQLLVRGARGDDYQVFNFPVDKPFNRGQIQKFLGEQLNVPPGKIVWPPYIEIPHV